MIGAKTTELGRGRLSVSCGAAGPGGGGTRTGFSGFFVLDGNPQSRRSSEGERIIPARAVRSLTPCTRHHMDVAENRLAGAERHLDVRLP